MALAGGDDAPVVIIPTAAAPDKNDRRAGGNAQRWFEGLGARNVELLRLVDRGSAENPDIVTALRNAKLIYMLGGFTHYLGQTLLGSASDAAMRHAYAKGAVIAGSSAGAMVLCDTYFNPSSGRVEPGLGYVSNAIVLPHHKNFGHRWASRLRQSHPDKTLIGIDERTGLVYDGTSWTVHGAASVTIYNPTNTDSFTAGRTLPPSFAPSLSG